MAYVTRNGRRVRRPSGATNSVQRLVKLEGTKATFECKAGHRTTHDYGKSPISKRVPADFLARMVAYWGLGLQSNGVRGHVYGWCQRCQNEADGVESKPRHKFRDTDESHPYCSLCGQEEGAHR